MVMVVVRSIVLAMHDDCNGHCHQKGYRGSTGYGSGHMYSLGPARHLEHSHGQPDGCGPGDDDYDQSHDIGQSSMSYSTGIML